MSDSQGSAPSTFWGEEVLTEMREGRSAVGAVAEITGKNPGRGRRQLTAFNVQDGTGHLAGAESIPVCGAAETNQAIAVAGPRRSWRDFPLRPGPSLVASWLPCVQVKQPLTVRVDLSDDPLSTLEAIHASATSGS